MKKNPYFKEKRAGHSHRLRLFCFPYAGGNNSIYKDWEKNLDKSVSLVTVHLKGRMERMGEVAVNDMQTLVKELYAEIRPYLNEPFAFFGHSLGGLIAFALLKHIEKETGKTAECIIVSASRAPHIYAENKIGDYSDENLTKKIKAYGNTPDYVLESKELMEMILPTLRADYQVLDSYDSCVGEALISQGVIFNCEDDVNKEVSLQWQSCFKKECFYVSFEEGHFFINTQSDKVISEVNRVLK
jgi:surfactin synthase thioesterase subunit